MRARLLRGDWSCAAPPVAADAATDAEGEAAAVAPDPSELADRRLVEEVGLALVVALSVVAD